VDYALTELALVESADLLVLLVTIMRAWGPTALAPYVVNVVHVLLVLHVELHVK